MSERRQQWIRFFEAALAGSTRSSLCAIGADYGTIVADAERIADAAMAALDARDFPPTKVEALVQAATTAWEQAEGYMGGRLVCDSDMARLGKALADLKAES